MKHPLTKIYLDLKDGRYIVQPLTDGPVGVTKFGEPTVVCPEAFSSSIADAVIENLEKFGRDKYDVGRAMRLSQTEYSRFLKGHLGVSVLKLESGNLTIRPLHRQRDGMIGFDKDSLVLSKSDLPHKLPNAIAEAFKRAT